MNPNQTIANPAREISVTNPINEAIERVKQVLFRPFDLGKWFIVGFCAWLALLGEQGGGGGGGNYNFGQGRSGDGILRELDRVKEYVMDNLTWIVPVVAAVVLIVVALGILFLWLNARGKFMFLHCVALNKAEVVAPWNGFSREANSLFLFRLVLSVVSAVLILPLVVLIVVLVIGMVKVEAATVAGVAGSVGALLVIIGLALVFFLIRKLTTDFVVPIMFLRRKKCLEGWGELRELSRGNLGNFILYFLFQLVMAMVIGAGIFIVVLATCCIAGCLMLLPYLGTVLLLPVHVFTRSYSLYYLAQFGPQFDVFVPASVTPGTIPPAA